MKNELGLWIDHREAIIVMLTAAGEEIKHIGATLEEHGRFSANAPGGSPEDRRDLRFGQQLRQYYAAVIAAIRTADAILILGPGEAKGELQKQLEQEKLGGRIVDIETVDKLTEPQLVAKVRKHFLKK